MTPLTVLATGPSGVESGVGSLHPSLTDETRRMIDEKALRRMKPTRSSPSRAWMSPRTS